MKLQKAKNHLMNMMKVKEVADAQMEHLMMLMKLDDSTA